MKRAFLSVIAAVVLVAGVALAGPVGAATSTITFDEVSALPSGITNLTGLYTAQGVSITGAYGIVPGNSQGNPGNWGLQGTSGPQFLGNNSGAPITISFTTAIYSFSIDCSRSNGSSAGNSVTVAGVPAGGAGTTATATFGVVNTWSTLSISGGPFTSVTITGAGTGFHPFGCDRMITNNAAPAPSTTTTVTPSTTTTTTAVKPAAAAAAAAAVAAVPKFTG